MSRKVGRVGKSDESDESDSEDTAAWDLEFQPSVYDVLLLDPLLMSREAEPSDRRYKYFGSSLVVLLNVMLQICCDDGFYYELLSAVCA